MHALTVASRFNSSWNNNSKCSYHTKFIAAARRETRRLLCTDFQLAAHAPYSDRADKRAHGGTYILLVGVGWAKVRVSISISVFRTKSFSQTLCHEVKLVRRARDTSLSFEIRMAISKSNPNCRHLRFPEHMALKNVMARKYRCGTCLYASVLKKQWPC